MTGKELTVDVKNKVFSYLRFKRNCIYVATEVGVYNSDILAISRKGDRLIEVETKISLADFKQDFKKSYRRYGREYKKHELYASAESSKSVWIPNYFYFAVPEKIHDAVLRLLLSAEVEKEDRDAVSGNSRGVGSKQNNRVNCGLICIDSDPLRLYDKLPHCSITKKAVLLHDRPVHEQVRDSIIMRMSSELITCRKRLAGCE